MNSEGWRLPDTPLRGSAITSKLIGLVMVIGLASKNAILIVEFAEQLQHRGLGLVESH